jgi:hypothetical protein
MKMLLLPAIFLLCQTTQAATDLKPATLAAGRNLVRELKEITESPLEAEGDSSEISNRAGGSGSGGGDQVAVSLIDALQRWADALEAQIDIMKSEVSIVRDSNRDLVMRVGAAKDESSDLRAQLVSLRNVNNDKKDEETRENVENIRSEVVLLSKTFSDFLQHYRDAIRQFCQFGFSRNFFIKNLSSKIVYSTCFSLKKIGES